MSLLKFEIYKLFKQKMVYFTFISLLIISSLYLLNFDRTTDSEKQLYREWEGPLTEEKVKRSQVENEKLTAMMEKREEQMKEDRVSGNSLSEKESIRAGLYESIAYIQGAKARTDLRLEELEEEQKDNTDLEASTLEEIDYSYFAYNKTPVEVIDYTSTFSLVVTGLMLLIGLSGSYSTEYRSGVDHYILSSKKGRHELAMAKMGAAVIFTVAIVMVGEAWNLLSKMFLFGNDGWTTTIQYAFKYYFSPYGLSMVNYHIIQVSIHLLAALSFALFILFISSLSRNILASLTISGAVFALPFFIVELIQMPIWLREALQFTYFYIMRVEFLFSDFHTLNFFGQPVIYPLVAVIWMIVLGVLFAILMMRVMKVRQVS
ncbi:hypothetical protein [Anaerobacillus sp. 1_MG-2023]|uniref:hypothetical protein n=1 Tax=Anaerobacillus sp. 1_MG-2023 TaxID=3062655 RepID=UPI0026E2B546|nr:hypothetical protein [Anaerobacillus sp. 1_MG-2023]MDO6658732.1 hypothetical protein [Anaerobacillus sp. 1_MG-2023]